MARSGGRRNQKLSFAGFLESAPKSRFPTRFFTAYLHDVPEDTPVSAEEILAFALDVFAGDRAAAEDAVALAIECCYSPEECLLPKADRKAAACRRWAGHPDIRVALVKSCDVRSNAGSAAAVSEEFLEEYLSWAGPLGEALARRISEALSAAGASAPGRKPTP